jgi:hypothetical protein
MTPLFSGIATGAPAWIDVYDRFRKGIDAADQSGVTKGRLDDALAGALTTTPATVLSYVRKHPEIPVQKICDRNPSQTDDPAGVLEPLELLVMVRRQRRLENVTEPDLQEPRATCLRAMSERLRRQMRIYFVSFGAIDSKSIGSTKLSDAERQELDSALAPGRKDLFLRPRGDGSLPDGPFRIRAIPRAALASCWKELANPEGPWEFSDAITDPRLPMARLLSACHVTPDEWDLTCEIGGFAPYFRHVRVRANREQWTLVEEDDTRRTRADRRSAGLELWPDCRSLSKSTMPSNKPLQQTVAPQ